MSVAYQIRPTAEKKQEISAFLTGYWKNDIWDIRDSFFDNLRPKKFSLSNKTIDFSAFSSSIKDEIKFMFAYRLEKRELRLITVIGYGPALKRFSGFLNENYGEISSIVDIPYEKAILQLRSYLIDSGISIKDNGEISSPHY